MFENVAEGKIVIDISDARNEANEWIERIGKMANEMCDYPDYNRIKLKTSETGQHTGFIIESNDAGALGCIGWAIEKHLDAIPQKLKPAFHEILGNTRTKKENLERS